MKSYEEKIICVEELGLDCESCGISFCLWLSLREIEMTVRRECVILYVFSWSYHVLLIERSRNYHHWRPVEKNDWQWLPSCQGKYFERRPLCLSLCCLQKLGNVTMATEKPCKLLETLGHPAAVRPYLAEERNAVSIRLCPAGWEAEKAAEMKASLYLNGRNCSSEEELQNRQTLSLKLAIVSAWNAASATRRRRTSSDGRRNQGGGRRFSRLAANNGGIRHHGASALSGRGRRCRRGNSAWRATPAARLSGFEEIGERKSEENNGDGRISSFGRPYLTAFSSCLLTLWHVSWPKYTSWPLCAACILALSHWPLSHTVHLYHHSILFGPRPLTRPSPFASLHVVGGWRLHFHLLHFITIFSVVI